MANPLTGDFEAVLQVSGGTINRLLASMHQNDFAKLDSVGYPSMLQDLEWLDRVFPSSPVKGGSTTPRYPSFVSRVRQSKTPGS